MHTEHCHCKDAWLSSNQMATMKAPHCQSVKSRNSPTAKKQSDGKKRFYLHEDKLCPNKGDDPC